MTVNSLSTQPASTVMATTEIRSLPFDTTALLAMGQTPSSPSFVLIDRATGLPITLTDAPAINGNVVTQIVRGSALAADGRYLLSLTFAAASSSVWTMVLGIFCAQ